jgi:hypothetical protein
MGDVVDMNGKPFESKDKPYPIDELIATLSALRNEIACCLVILRYNDGVDDWIESDILLPDTRIAMATFMLNESTKMIGTYLILTEMNEDDDDKPA